MLTMSRMTEVYEVRLCPRAMEKRLQINKDEIIVTEYAGIYHPTHIKLHKVETQEKQ
jgi:hypothetical protein